MTDAGCMCKEAEWLNQVKQEICRILHPLFIVVEIRDLRWGLAVELLSPLNEEDARRVHFRSVFLTTFSATLNCSVAVVMSRRYSPPYYSPPRRGYGGRGRSPPPPPRRGYGGGGRKGSSHGSLLVRNIPLDCRPEELRVPFERFGPVRDVYIPRDYYSGATMQMRYEHCSSVSLLTFIDLAKFSRSSLKLKGIQFSVCAIGWFCWEPRGFAFVEFVDAYDAGEAQRSMNRRIFGGREITVVVASESRKRPEEMRVKTRTRSREPSGSRGRSHGRSRSRSISRSRSPRRPSDSRNRRRSRSYSPAPRRRGADYSASPRRRQEERPRSPLRSPPRGEGDAKYSRRSYSPGHEGAAAAAGDRDANGDNETREKPDYEPEERRRGGREVSRSPSGSRSRSVEASPR
ncbi:hypothetical protein Bca4012_031555 [Brassica carinata]